MSKSVVRVAGVLLSIVLIVTLVLGCSESSSSPAPTTTGSDNDCVPTRITTSETMPDYPGELFPCKVLSVEGKKVAIIWTILQHPVLTAMSRLIDDLNDKYYHMEITNYDSEHEADKANSLMQAAIASKPDLIITQPVDALSHQKFVLEAQAQGIPVVGMLELTLGADYTVCGDAYGSAVAGVEYLCEQLNYKGNVINLEGDYTSYFGTNRRRAMRDVIAKYPDMKIIAEADMPTGQWTRQGGYDAMKTLLSAHDQIDGLYVGTDPSAVGAIQAYKEAGRLGETIIVGGDFTPEGVEAIKAGEMAASVQLSPLYYVRRGMAAVVDLLTDPDYVAGSERGGEISPYKVISQDNLYDWDALENCTYADYWKQYGG